jgi:hypothetical protein
MAFDEATAIQRLDALDPGQIALIQPLLDTAKSLAETYCNRKFDLADEVEVLVPVFANTLSLRRYPLDDVSSIVQAHGAGNVAEWHLNKDAGLVYMHGWLASHEVTVTYKGGYAVLPADLELALWFVFHDLWAMTPGAGISLGSSVGGVGAISKINVPDVGTVTFASGSAETSSRGGAMGGAIQPIAAGILNLYRRELV